MSKTVHRIYIVILTILVVVTLTGLILKGYDYYQVNLEERFFHEDHKTLKPSGPFGHGLGIIGSLLIIAGVGSYMAKKRFRFLTRVGVLKHWLEFHIFLCTVGPIMILFHTSFKFGGLVSISFWSMVAVFLSGIIGRFIYIQIPRTVEGRELSLSEVRGMKDDIAGTLRESYQLDEVSHQVVVNSIKRKVELHHKNTFMRYIMKYRSDRITLKSLRAVLREVKLSKDDKKKIVSLVKNDISLNRRIDRLNTMQRLFKYWHVAHLPFALVMIIIMIIHVGVTIVFGYRWIF
ncbi:MAG: hypothetical protein JEZ03_08040 [Bacteroidales bacterium]|nr:hypothetical protein [Bacteroidales bacterium]